MRINHSSKFLERVDRPIFYLLDYDDFSWNIRFVRIIKKNEQIIHVEGYIGPHSSRDVRRCI